MEHTVRFPAQRPAGVPDRIIVDCGRYDISGGARPGVYRSGIVLTLPYRPIAAHVPE